MKDKLEIIQNMGLNWTAFRVKYELEKRLGLLQRQFPTFTYDEFSLRKHLISNKNISKLLEDSRKNFFFFDIPENYREYTETFNLIKVIEEANNICRQTFRYFSMHSFRYESIKWNFNPVKKVSAPDSQHWVNIADLGSDFGDIKWIWELSRFSFVYPLVRAYGATGDDKYIESFWRYFEDFIEKNPPELGPNYKCGQEMSLRIMAWMFGLFAFLDHPLSSDSRKELMLKAIYHHADHVEKHFSFALKSVKNNHSLSEAAGMYTVGVLFPYFDKAEKWRKKGKKYLHSESMWQIYEDGSYIQHSMNYQRLAIQDLTWALRLGQINKDPFEEAFIQRFRKTVLFMYQNQDLTKGRLPNYGMNDGAYIHPLTSCEYLDYRPALQAAWYVINGELLYNDESVSETVYWLAGPMALNSNIGKIEQTTCAFNQGGYFTIRGKDSFGMIRCASYKHRPAQADMLHFDLWHKGLNILADAGTFSYNTEMDKILYFNGTASHNTVMVNNKDQMKKATRFIWLNWTKSKALRFEHESEYQIFEGEHYGYGKITHRRGILQVGDQWVIVDDLFGNIEKEEISLSWLFGIQNIEEISNSKWLLRIEDENQWEMSAYSTENFSSKLFKGSEKPLKGWRSLYYGHKEPYPQAVLECNIDREVRFITIIGPKSKNHSISTNLDYLDLTDRQVKLYAVGNSKIFNMN